MHPVIFEETFKELSRILQHSLSRLPVIIYLHTRLVSRNLGGEERRDARTYYVVHQLSGEGLRYSGRRHGNKYVNSDPLTIALTNLVYVLALCYAMIYQVY